MLKFNSTDHCFNDERYMQDIPSVIQIGKWDWLSVSRILLLILRRLTKFNKEIRLQKQKYILQKYKMCICEACFILANLTLKTIANSQRGFNKI